MGFGKFVGWAGAILVGGAVVNSIVSSDPVVVEKLVDGDTIDVRLDGETTRVRLLNVNTPEIGRDGKPSECLAEDARSFLEGRIPEGTEVKLEFDKERLDKYGRTLAGVFVGDELVNAAIAREGLGVAVDIAPNHRFYAEVYAAEQEASREERGISTLGPDCYVAAEDAAKLNEAQSAVSNAEQFVASMNRLDLDSDLAEARRLVARLALAQTGLKALEQAGERQSSFQRDAFG
ncbi:thermonuclease family protein, partial [Corynebacterium sp.]|uniref:thermonuclease family protein n=1 Tax=Corynebacterium sp. TaxID=1720 RepID=UPI002A918862